LEAEKIIMIVTPKYLGICNLHQSKSNKEKKWSFDDDLVYNEIALISDKLNEKGMAADKFIGILIVQNGTICLTGFHNSIVINTCKNGKVDEDILFKPGFIPIILYEITLIDHSYSPCRFLINC
jgi:hypothetical protein